MISVILNIFIIAISTCYTFYGIISETIKNKLDEKKIKDNSIDFDYYRELLKEYSFGTLSLIYNKKFDPDKETRIIILNLIKKGYLKVENKKIIRTDKDFRDLSEEEKIVYENTKYMVYKDSILNISHKKEFSVKWYKDLAYKEALDKGFLEKRSTKLEFGGIILLASLLLIFTFNFGQDFEKAISIITLIIIGFEMSIFERDAFIYKEKGYILHNKLVGLKRFINDFSNINEEELKKVYFYDEYVLYALMFNSKSKLIKELTQKIN